MPRLAVLVSTATLLLGPTVLAFFAGGYFDGPRAAAAAIAWAMVLLLCLAGPLPLPASRSGRVALAALAGLAIWSAISLSWAPLIGPALDSVGRLLLYIAVLLVAVATLRDPRMTRAVEPLLALGALVVIGYGLSGRLLPGVIDLITERSYGAAGRLEQPITYWNAEGPARRDRAAALRARRRRPLAPGRAADGRRGRVRPARRRRLPLLLARRRGGDPARPVRPARDRALLVAAARRGRGRRGGRAGGCGRLAAPRRGVARRHAAASRSATARSWRACWRC